MFDTIEWSTLYIYLQFAGKILSAPVACLYTYKMIGYGMKAAQAKFGTRVHTEDETCFGLCAPFYYWNCMKKAMLLPLLFFLIGFGVSTLMSCGNQFACFCLVYHLWRKGFKVNPLLLVFLFGQVSIFLWHTYSMSTVVASLIPESYELLSRMFEMNLYYTAGNLLSILILLSCTLFWVIKMNKKRYETSVIAASGAGASLATLSDFSTILSNSLAVGIPGFKHIIICLLADIWSLGLMLAFVAVVESRPFPLLMALVQPFVFGICSFLFALMMYGTLDGCSFYQLKSAPAMFAISIICILIDSCDPSCPQEDGAPQQFYLVGAMWEQILEIRNAIFQDAPETKDHDIEFGIYNIEHISNQTVEGRLSRKGGLFNSPSELTMTSPKNDDIDISESIEIVFGD